MDTEWRTDIPKYGAKILMLCALFDEKEYRTLSKNPWGGWNRTIYSGVYRNGYYANNYNHASGDPYPQVLAWKYIKEEEDLGAPYYDCCLGSLRD